MRQNHFLSCLAVTFLAATLGTPIHAQSVADAARAAKEKKQKQSAAAPSSDAAPAKTRVITNDEIPEAHSDSQPTSPKAGNNSAAPKSTSSSSSIGTGTSLRKMARLTVPTPPTSTSSSLPEDSSAQPKPRPSGC